MELLSTLEEGTTHKVETRGGKLGRLPARGGGMLGPGQEDSKSLLGRGKEGVNLCRIEAAGCDWGGAGTGLAGVLGRRVQACPPLPTPSSQGPADASGEPGGGGHHHEGCA